MSPRAAVHAAIHDILPALGEDEIDESKHLKALGADSVDRLEIIMLSLDRSGVSAPLSRFSDVPDVGSLIALISTLQKDAAS